MMQTDLAIARAEGIDVLELRQWVERGWVVPEGPSDGWEFQDIDVARVRLIRALRHEMEVGEDALPMVLSLLDQVYDLRRTLRDVLRAVERQGPPVREAVTAALRQHEPHL